MSAEGFYDRALALWSEGRQEEALAACTQAVTLKPGFAQAHYNRGYMLQQLRRLPEAVAAYEQALTFLPTLVPAWNNRGALLQMLGRGDDAMASFGRALALDPSKAGPFYNRGALLLKAGRHDEAARDFARALALEPDHPDAFGCLVSAAAHACDFPRVAALSARLDAVVADGRFVVAPLMFLGLSDDPAAQRHVAENYVRATIPPGLPQLWNGERYHHDRIRIAYLSGDFRKHATAWLMADLFARHDRSRFEVFGVSFGSDDGSAIRRRIIASFDAFHDVAGCSDAETAALLRRLEADIVIDLKGHTEGERPEILARRPAPLQISYLGYPGTMGCDFIDAILADAIVLPRALQPFYSEEIVHLPGCYQVNDPARPTPSPPPRAELGLPPDGFVFCNFGNSWKITQSVFAAWMRLLAALPDSVLWLLADSPDAGRNLRKTAREQGIEPNRLIFAPRLELDAHLARHGAADLFLDTRPYGAHTTASDALWMGLPLVTCAGQSFASRVSSSLLAAVGLPELATQTFEDYENLALALARDPARLQAIRAKLAAARHTAPLFDAAGFCQGLESAYLRLHRAL